MRACASPARRATSRTNRRASATGLAWETPENTLNPSRQSDDRSLPGGGSDVELVAEPLRAAEPEPEAGACRVPILQRHGKVGDSWPLISEGEAYAAALPIAYHFDTCGAAAAVIYGIAGNLARCGDDFRLIHQAEADADCARPHRLPHPDHIVGGANRHRLIRFGRHRRARNCRWHAGSAPGPCPR